jgi:hypothetical protein
MVKDVVISEELGMHGWENAEERRTSIFSLL